MNIILLITLILSPLAYAGGVYEIKMTCGEVKSARNGQLLRRLEPNLFGLNDKFVLRTKFTRFIDIHEIASEENLKPEPIVLINKRKVAYTKFSLKDKFQKIKKEFKKAIKDSKRFNTPIFACVGHIDVHTFKYSGSHVYFSHESVEDAIEQTRRQARRHL